MNVEMWDNPATQRNWRRLRADGIEILGPGERAQACGEIGLGRMLEPHELLEELVAFFQPKTAGRQARAADGRADLRADRPGARHHQSVVGQDGLCDRPRSARRRGPGDADRGPDCARDAARRAARRCATAQEM